MKNPAAVFRTGSQSMLLAFRQCEEGDLNPHGFYPTGTSNLRVYQFHHPREKSRACCTRAADPVSNEMLRRMTAA